MRRVCVTGVSNTCSSSSSILNTRGLTSPAACLLPQPYSQCSTLGSSKIIGTASPVKICDGEGGGGGGGGRQNNSTKVQDGRWRLFFTALNIFWQPFLKYCAESIYRGLFVYASPIYLAPVEKN